MIVVLSGGDSLDLSALTGRGDMRTIMRNLPDIIGTNSSLADMSSHPIQNKTKQYGDSYQIESKIEYFVLKSFSIRIVSTSS